MSKRGGLWIRITIILKGRERVCVVVKQLHAALKCIVRVRVGGDRNKIGRCGSEEGEGSTRILVWC